MTDEEQRQVQNIITARTKLLTAKIQQQENKIISLNQEIEQKNSELEQKNIQLNQLQVEFLELQEQLDINKSSLLELQNQIEILQQKNSQDVSQEFQDENLDNFENIEFLEQVPDIPKQPETYLQSLLKQHFQQDSFKNGFENLIQNILDSKDVFAVIPNELDRILCFQLPAIITPAITLVISPSLNVIKDNPSLPSIYIHSSLSTWQRAEIFNRAKKNFYKIIYTTPSQLLKDDFKDFIKHSEISTVIVNSKWTDDFHNEFLRITKSISSLSFSSKKRPSIAAFIDIAGSNAQNEIINLLGLNEPYIFIAELDLKNTFFDVVKSENKLTSVCNIISERSEKSGVIICQSPQDSDDIISELEQFSIFANYYSGSEKKFLDDFNSSKSNLIITSHAAISKISRQDLQFIIHFDIPDSLENFYQDISRLNNALDNVLDNENSESIILASNDDFKNQNISQSVKDFCKGEKCFRNFLLNYFGENNTDLNCNNCAYCLGSNFTEETESFNFGKANEAQRQAISTSEGPVLIIAGPGTGKTFTLVQRTVYLIQECKVNPKNIFISTFTDKAAHELLSRISSEFIKRNIEADINQIQIGTFHSLCQKILLEHIELTSFKKNFRVIDDFEQTYLVFRNIEKFDEINGLNLVFTSQGKWKHSQEICDYLKILFEELVAPEDLITEPEPSISAVGYAMKVYFDLLLENNSLDFSSLLSETYKLFTNNPEILNELCSNITHIMIDEYQDTNYIQEQLVLMLGGDKNNICVVGDDDQSLYRFRGATVRNILEFPQKFSGNQCKIIHLTENYRSEKDIIDFYNNWLDSLKTWGNFRYPKKIEPHKKFIPAGKLQNPSVMKISGFDSPDDWHEKILKFINTLSSAGKLHDYNQIAFLFRSVKDSRVQALSNFLERNGINVFSPRSDMFFKRVEIKFAIGCFIFLFQSYAKALENGDFKFAGKDPDYVIYYKSCLDMISHYIEKPVYYKLNKYLKQKSDEISKIELNTQKLQFENYTFSNLLYELFAFSPFKEALNINSDAEAKYIRRASNLAKFSEIIRDFENEYNVNNFSAKFVFNITKTFFNIYLRFVRENGIFEDGCGEIKDSLSEKTPSGCVAFMTSHQAKGMEFPIVFVDSLWDIPQDDKKLNDMTMLRIEKKYFRHSNFEPYDQIKNFDFWRLYYTAFSRAKNLLILTCLEDKNTPGKCFKKIYNALPETENKNFDVSKLHLRNSKKTRIKKIYSFTSSLVLYGTCPLQYKFFKEFGFLRTRNSGELFGSIVHATLEDIHKLVLNHDENFTQKIADANIQNMLDKNYESLSKSEHAYLTKAQRAEAVQQVLRYVWQQQGHWNSIKNSELEIMLVRPDYILEGKIDLVRSINNTNNNEDLEIIDFKSGVKPNININRDRGKLETYRKQLNIYAYLFSKNFPDLNIKRMSLYYTGEENGSPLISFAYNKNEIEKTIEFFDNTVHKIMNLEFAGINDFSVCNKCDFKYYCNVV